jgi:hypothetical protein
MSVTVASPPNTACSRRRPTRGAYARFKELLASQACLDKWYAFEAESTEQALRDWCAENKINVIGNDEQSA